MKTDRAIIQMTREGLTIKQIAARLDKYPESVIKAAKRLGIYLKPPGVNRKKKQ